MDAPHVRLVTRFTQLKQTFDRNPTDYASLSKLSLRLITLQKSIQEQLDLWNEIQSSQSRSGKFLGALVGAALSQNVAIAQLEQAREDIKGMQGTLQARIEAIENQQVQHGPSSNSRLLTLLQNPEFVPPPPSELPKSKPIVFEPIQKAYMDDQLPFEDYVKSFLTQQQPVQPKKEQQASSKEKLKTLMSSVTSYISNKMQNSDQLVNNEEVQMPIEIVNEEEEKLVKEKMEEMKAKLRAKREKEETNETPAAVVKPNAKYYYDLRKKILTQETQKTETSQNFLKARENEQNEAKHEKQELETDMLRMAQGMKAFASGFKSQFQQDEHLMNKISSQQDVNMDKTTIERDKLAEIQHSAVSSFCKRLFMLAFATAVMVFMFFFVWLFPNKVKHYSEEIA
ncbi:hypothetical protein FGO68_gene10011 [Halteria grandinella]|uniref:Uncharacterized protein n=1 Tax=Halteria grandinella TaxID=5974 RepID=A0A8J8NM30_HALGN|nr:hypothetical protein FGO68_gene10011 [Halteria grandinella]